MRHSDPQYDWELFRFAINRRSLYILGAGASLPQIRGDFSRRIRQLVWANGIYEGSSQVHSPLTQSILRPDPEFDRIALRTGLTSQNALDANTPNTLVEILLARLLTIPSPMHPPQYAVFDRFPASVLFNFNNDNLGDTVHPRHLCLRPHGIVDARFVHAPVVRAAMRFLAIPQDYIDALDYHRPLPEPNDVTSRPPYRALIYCFDSLQAVVIIGYSFGEQPETGVIHDAESFEQITDLLRWRPKPVLVIGPAPESVFGRIKSAVRAARVSMLCCKWNALAEFVLSGAFTQACKQAWRGDLRAVTPAYQAFESAIAAPLLDRR